MKYLIRVFLFICLLSGNISGQSKWELGPIAGVGITSVKYDQLDYFKSPFGPTAGVFVQYEIKPFLAVQANLAYDLKVFSSMVTLTDVSGIHLGSIRQQSRFEYISMPLMASWRFGKKAKLMINTGTYFNYLAGQSVVIKGFSTGKEVIAIPIEKRWDSGILVGLGLASRATERITFYLEFRNYFGLINVSQHAPMNAHRNTQAVLFGAGFKLAKPDQE